MSRIDKYNYEAFFLDYWENNLDARQEAMLFTFLEEHADLKIEFEAYEDLRFPPLSKIEFADKESLRTGVIQDAGEINASNYEEFLIASLENDLNNDQQHQLELFLHHNPAIKQELALFEKTKLSADPELIYEQKENLYRRNFAYISLSNIYRIVGAAASLLILFGLYQLLSKPQVTPEAHSSERLVSYTMNKLSKAQIPELNQLAIYHRQSADVSPKYQSIPQRANNIGQLPSLETSPALLSGNNVNTQISLLDPLIPPSLIILQYRIDQQQAFLAENNSMQDKTLLGKIISGLFKNVSDRVQPEKETMDEMKPDRVSFWDLAESGISGYNYLTDNDVILVRTIDKDGKTKNVRFLRDNEVVSLPSGQ